MTDETKGMVDFFEYDDIWEYKFKPSDNLFVRKVVFVAEDNKDDQTMFMLHYLKEEGMLCLLASEDLDACKRACMEFYMSQHPSES